MHSQTAARTQKRHRNQQAGQQSQPDVAALPRLQEQGRRQRSVQPGADHRPSLSAELAGGGPTSTPVPGSYTTTVGGLPTAAKWDAAEYPAGRPAEYLVVLPISSRRLHRARRRDGDRRTANKTASNIQHATSSPQSRAGGAARQWHGPQQMVPAPLIFRFVELL